MKVCFLSNMDNLRTLMTVMSGGKVKKTYVRPRTYVYNKNEDLVSQTIHSTGRLTKNAEGKLRYTLDVEQLVNAMFLRRILTYGKKGYELCKKH